MQTTCPVTAHFWTLGAKMVAETQRRDGRTTDYEAKTDWQKWLKPYLDKNSENDTTPSNYQELARELIRRGVDVDENTIYRVVRGDPTKYANAKRPGFDVAAATGEILGDIVGSVKAAGYRLPPALIKSASSNLPVKRYSEEALQVADYYEGLEPGTERNELSAKAQAEQERRRRQASKEGYRESGIIGKLPEDEDDIERIPEE